MKEIFIREKKLLNKNSKHAKNLLKQNSTRFSNTKRVANVLDKVRYNLFRNKNLNDTKTLNIPRVYKRPKTYYVNIQYQNY